jgi:hypothetical protein
MVGNREVIAEPSFLEDESSPIVFQRFAYRLETGSEDIAAQAALCNTTFPTTRLLARDVGNSSWIHTLRVA